MSDQRAWFWKIIAYAAVVVLWAIIAATSGWSLREIVSLKIEVAKIEYRLQIQPSTSDATKTSTQIAKQ